ncbi:bcl-2 homologous antagonist/killer-like isoform X2 [Lineus longissimus]|uniref:bcl-2 homologous antagonist/killer-like isoform X2 n=1 Tax=Lineus longissimus TaxID=88925 RepID=UPI002B4DD41E
MACKYPHMPDDDDTNGIYPQLRLKDDNAPPIIPDSEENVGQETEGIFRSYMYQQYQQEMNPDNIEQIEQTPSLPELTSFALNPMSQASHIGRQLALIGDDINERHRHVFDSMIASIKLENAPDLAYEAFAGIARRLFHDGNINWGRIITLLSFGYRMAVTVLTTGVRGFFSKIVRFVVDFIMKEKIAKWIAEQGGWIAAFSYIPKTTGMNYIVFIGALAAFSIASVIWFSKR